MTSANAPCFMNFQLNRLDGSYHVLLPNEKVVAKQELLTAFDTAKLRALQERGELGAGQAVTKAALQGALTLYLDFINLFLIMLRLLGGGRRRD